MLSSSANKTSATDAPVEKFLASVASEQKRSDARALIALMSGISGAEPAMWGPSIIGFERCRYKYESGREGEMPIISFSPRSDALTIYCGEGTARHEQLLAQLGPHKLGKVCLYIKRLADVDMAVLEQILCSSYEYVLARKDAMHKVERGA